MRRKELVTVPVEPALRIVERTCAICGVVVIDLVDVYRSSWSRGSYVVDEVIVEHRTGMNYPDGGGGKATVVDLCPKCFDEVLIPFLKTKIRQPTEIQTELWDY